MGFTNTSPDFGEPDTTYILVTGTNSGIGFSICCRTIDEFLSTHPPSQSLNLLFTTRSAKKSAQTLSRLQSHLTTSAAKHHTTRARVTLTPEHVDLSNLLSVRALSRRLLTTLPKLDAIILNAGIAGFTGLNYPKAIYLFCTELVNAITWTARYTRSDTGVLAKKQTTQPDEPALGHIFLANVFGHYMLAHALMPVLSACGPQRPGRVVWTSSVEATPGVFDVGDVQTVRSRHAYEASKYLADALALTADLPGSKKWVDGFLDPSPSPSSSSLSSSSEVEEEEEEGAQPPTTPKKYTRPNIYLSHPGVCATSIVPLIFPLPYLMIAAFYIARLLGSPWHVVSSYKGACSAVFLALAPQPVIDEAEGAYARHGGGKVKWGSACDVWGRESAVCTEVQGWGFGGVVGGAVFEGDKRRRRKEGATDLTVEERKGFEEVGWRCWREMEGLRRVWEGVLDREEAASGVEGGKGMNGNGRGAA
ncbi:3-keto-steroid reductase [Onygenales sp. PD_40]|nr:3-keto-steroid reductase [Onygenales sp. PD_40]